MNDVGAVQEQQHASSSIQPGFYGQVTAVPGALAFVTSLPSTMHADACAACTLAQHAPLKACCLPALVSILEGKHVQTYIWYLIITD